ncbi:MAG: septation protein A [Gammaproteobacteria bacterium]|nr:septation protein A [Gammaproteobacteria bacterium]MDH5801271.1 septation protein A [Gammaproteobacteria bacterium]
MKFLFDFFPLILFFVTYKMYDIFVATGAVIIATIAQMIFFWVKHRRLEKMHVITLVLVVVFGGATILFQDETFIKWKFSVVNWLFGLVFLGSHFIGNKTLIQRMLDKQITLPQFVWNRLNISWAVFFIAFGFANLYVMFNYDTDTWVDFKTFGNLGLTLLFIMGQGIYMHKHLKPEPE